jgi:hypothetical protein
MKMNAKCSECGGTNFSVQNPSNVNCSFVVCNSCGTIAGTLERLNFLHQYNAMSSSFTNINNRISNLEEQNKQMFNILEDISVKINRR